MRLWPLFLTVSLLCAQEVRFDATKAYATKERLELQSKFDLDYSGHFLSSGYGIYEKNKARLYKGVEFIEQKAFNAYASSALLRMDEDRFKLSNFFFNEKDSKVWMEGEKAEGNQTKITLEKAFLTSCDVECSDWKFSFGWGDLDRNAHWINLYNIAFYVNDVPILYFPYVGFSTLKERHTGLLRPIVGISDKEGLVYIQPFFYAPTNWWDLELDPQIRTKRGKGLYATFRFVDSPSSYGEIRTGIFAEKESYQKELAIQNKYHRGVEFYYKRREILSAKDAQDGFYLDLKAYNDVDYFNLQKQRNRGFVPTLDISRLNYFWSDDANYFGVSARYFKYNNKTPTSELFHILPALNYHRYVEAPFERFNIAYNFDAQITNYYQRDGYDALVYNFLLPVKFYFTFLDGFLNFSVSERLNLLFADYYGSGKARPKDYRYFRNAHELSLYGDLVKSYPGFFHTLSFDASLLVPSFESERGERASFLDLEEYRKSLTLGLKQYFRFPNSDLFVYHFLKQRIEYDTPDELQDIENEIGISKKRYALNLNTLYSYKHNSLQSLTLTGRYRGETLKGNVSYIFRNRTSMSNKEEIDTQFLRGDFHTDLSNHNELFATIDYNIELGRYKGWSIGWRKRERCWSLLMRYRKDTIPILTSTGSGFYNDNAFLIRFELYPLGGIEHSFSQYREQRTF